MELSSLRSRLADPGSRSTLLAAAGGVLLLLVALVTAAQAWWIAWPGRLWLTLGAAVAVAVAALLARRRPQALLWVGFAVLGLLVLAPAYLYGTDGGGLRIAGLHFDDLVGGLFLAAVGLAVWWLTSLAVLPWWSRAILIGLGLHAAIPVAMGLAERIPFGEALVGLWTLPYWLQGAYFGAAILLPGALVMTLLGLWQRSLRPAVAGRRGAVSLAVVFFATSLVCAFEMNSRGLVNALSFLPHFQSSAPATAPTTPSIESLGSVSASAEHRALTTSSAPETPVLAGVGDADAGWEDIFAQVRDDIGFEPTRNSLRSPDGVVLNGRGNSLEQARLLRARLTAAGERVRYAQGHLERAQASTLIAATLPAAVELSHPETVPISHPTEDARLLERLDPHYWVQLEQRGEWLDLDPSFAGAEPGARFARLDRTWDRLPAEHEPTAALRVDVERLGRPGHREPVLTWEGPFDDLSNAAVGLVVIARIESDSDEAETEPETSLDVFGALGGRAAKPQGRSDTKTSVYEAALTVGDASLAQGAFRVAGGPLDAAGSDAIERIDLRFEIRYPDGRREEVVRPLFETNDASERPPLFQRHSILLTANRIPESWFRQLLDATLARRDAEAVRERLDRLKKSLRDGKDAAELYQEAVSLERSLGLESGHLVNLAFASISDQLADEMGRELSVFAYYDKPRILISTFQGSGNELEVFLDLRQDSCAAISYPGQALLRRESFLYGRGVLESILEAKIVELFTGQRPLSTAGLMLDAAAQEVPIVMYSDLERSRIGELDLSPRARQRVLAALDRGKIVALPTRGIEHRERQRWGWWEVEPTTREAVGVLDTGLHQATVQRTLIESEGALDEDMAWVIGAITGATDTHWVLAALILEYGELNKAALQEAKAYLKQIGEYLCSDIKVGKVWETGVTVAEVKAEIEGCWEEGYSLGVGASAGAEITILDTGWCKGFQKGFTCSSMTILNAYLADA
ncbi:MAG: PRA1 family protein [bacterium]|nr:PRA1 family protein [bacterium]